MGKKPQQCFKTYRSKTKKCFWYYQEVAIITGSGTSGLEAAVVNVVQPGDEVLVIVTGAFGERFSKICEAYNIKIHQLDVEWGQALNPADIKQLCTKSSGN